MPWMATVSEWVLEGTRTNYIIEYFHRIFVVITAGTIYATATFAYVKIKTLQHLTILAAIVVTIQIVIGALVVNSRLDIRLVSLHLPIGVALFGITLLTFLLFIRSPPIDALESYESK